MQVHIVFIKIIVQFIQNSAKFAGTCNVWYKVRANGISDYNIKKKLIKLCVPIQPTFQTSADAALKYK